MAIIPGTEMRYRPLDNYANMQNPPDFPGPGRRALPVMT